MKKFNEFINERKDVEKLNDLTNMCNNILGNYFNKIKNIIENNKQFENDNLNVLELEDIKIIFDDYYATGSYNSETKVLRVDNDIKDYISKIKNKQKDESLTILNDLRNHKELIEETISIMVHELAHKLDPSIYVKTKKRRKYDKINIKMNDKSKLYHEDPENFDMDSYSELNKVLLKSYYNLPTEVNSFFLQFCKMYANSEITFDDLFNKLKDTRFYSKADAENKKRLNKRLYDFYEKSH